MSIGADIAEVYEEVGTQVSIIKHDGTGPFTEYITYEINVQASSPFVTQFMLDASFVYNTDAAAGDVVQFIDDSSNFIIASFNKERFEGEVVINECILYRCNALAEVLRKTSVRNQDTLRLENVWTPVIQGEPVLITGLVDMQQFVANDHSFFAIPGLNLHISGNIDLKVGDRVDIDSGAEVYEVRAVESRRLNNLTMARVTPDNRE
jgi:hypothetical protein